MKSNETDVDEDTDADEVDEVVDEQSNETEVQSIENMFSNHKKNANQSKDDDKKVIDFVEIANNVFLDKKRTKLMKLQMIMISMKIYFKSIVDVV